MDNWGCNPATVEAVATVFAALFAIVAVWIGFRTGRESRAEIDARMRPWVGLHGFGFERNSSGTLTISALLRNNGPLPALDAHLVIEVRPRFLEEIDELVIAAVLDWPEQKALIPEEDGNYGKSLPCDTYPDLEKWIAASRDLIVIGTFTYSFGKRHFKSIFQAELWFRSRPKPPDELVSINWRNISAT